MSVQCVCARATLKAVKEATISRTHTHKLKACCLDRVGCEINFLFHKEKEKGWRERATEEENKDREGGRRKGASAGHNAKHFPITPSTSLSRNQEFKTKRRLIVGNIDKMNLADLMEQSLLKECAYMPNSQRRSFSKTRPLGDGKTPDHLAEWVSFDSEVEQFWAEVRGQLEGIQTPPYSRRFMRCGVITEEIDIRACFSSCIAQPVTDAARRGLQKELAISSASSIGVSNANVGGFITKPKLPSQVNQVTSSSDVENEDSEDEGDEICLNDFILAEEVVPIEVKPQWQVTLRRSVSVIQMMTSAESSKVRHALSQIFLYMVLEEARYGVLTTKDRSIFLRQYRDGVLKCLEGSRTICHNDPIGVRKCFLFILMKAEDSEEIPISQTLTTPEESKWIQPNRNKRYSPLKRNKKKKRKEAREGTSNGGEQALEEEPIIHLSDEEVPSMCTNEDRAKEEELERWARSLDNYELDYFNLVHQVKKSACHSVWKGRIGTTDAAIKLYDFSDNLKELKQFHNEVHTYKKLSQLQGSVIPILIDYGLSWDGFLGFVAIGWIGDEVDFETLSRKDKASLASAVESIHESGVLHGDLSSANILCGKTRGKYFFVDFEYAKHDPCRKEIYNEMKDLCALLKV